MILTQDQSAIRDAVRDCSRERILPSSVAYEAAGGFPPALFRNLGSLGMTAANGALSTIVSIQNSTMVSGTRECPGLPNHMTRNRQP